MARPVSVKGEMASSFRTFVVVDRSQFKLKVYTRSLTSPRWRLTHSYPIALGALGYTTPGGMWEIDWKVKNPDWVMPHSDWVPQEDRGKVIPGGDPANPLKAAFINLAGSNGVGIHGTANVKSIGTRASHGCIRMTVEGVLDLYKRVRKGTQVYIV